MATATVGDPQIRHRGTFGGSLANADPAADLPAVAVALDASFVIAGADGRRTVPASEFFQGVFMTSLGPHDLLTEIRVPATSGGWSYQKFHPRAQDWAIVGVAVAVNGGPKIALTNMGPTPIRATAVEKALADGADPTTAAERAIDGTDPIDDPFATAEYRRALAPVLVRRAIEEALAG